MVKSEIVVGYWLSEYRPSREMEFDWEVGQGELTDQEYAELIAGTKVRSDAYFRVDEIRLKQGENDEQCAPVGEEDGPGWKLFRYKVPDTYDLSEPYQTLKIAVTARAEIHHGWFHYQQPRTVAELLEIDFEAPFRCEMVAHLGRGQLCSGPTLSSAGGNTYLYRVVHPGPVSLGRHVFWVYPRGDSRETDVAGGTEHDDQD